MSTSLKTRVLTNGKSTWRLTRFSDELFIAKNSFGKQHTFRCVAEVNNFEDFLLPQYLYKKLFDQREIIARSDVVDCAE